MKRLAAAPPVLPVCGARVALAVLRAFSELLALAVLLVLPTGAGAAELPIFDAHIHYSHDAWETLPPGQAIELLRKAGVRGALVSSSNDDGTQKLVAEAPDLIVPELRPYRTRSDLSTWVRDEAVAAHVEERLRRYRYVAIGEFHVYGADADLPVVRRVVAAARQYGLMLHAHSDADAIERLFRQWPQARILWAHSGFERPEKVREMLRRHRNLWADLAFRSEHGSGGKVSPEWREAFLEFPDRFLVGTDTYVPERWHYVGEHAAWSRAWLADLPRDVAERIGWKNGEALFGEFLKKQGS
jgi:predicted TIM-barrel fold metal-dependent hydrolase